MEPSALLQQVLILKARDDEIKRGGSRQKRGRPNNIERPRMTRLRKRGITLR